MNEKLKEVLNALFGLDLDNISNDIIEKNIQNIKDELNLDDDTFLSLLQTPFLNTDLKQALAKYFLINESYFLRDADFYEGLEKVLTNLIDQRKNYEIPYLRIWSAGCSLGQEPYSIALLLYKLLGYEINGWNITILATDINEQNLQKAKEGVFNQWSFRDTPSWIYEYFDKKNQKFFIRENIKKLVQFKKLNLISDDYPSFLNNTNDMDIIICRNVLLYFDKENIKKTVNRFYDCLNDDGYLSISSVEYDFILFDKFKEAVVKKTIFFQKENGFELKPVLQKEEAVFNIKTENKKDQKKDFSGIATLKSQKDIKKAIGLCENLLVKDSKNIELNYYYAHLLQNDGELKKAIKVLEKIIYLDDETAMAYISLSNIYRCLNILDKSKSYLLRAKRLLESKDKDEIVFLSDNMSVSYLTHMIERIGLNDGTD